MSFTGLLFGLALLAQNVDATGTAVAKPIGQAYLEEETGSYFQVFEFYGRPPHTWRHAKEMVRGYLHQGREGRLAHVKSQNTHYFLLMSFPLVRQQPMWIGLSAQCNEKADLNWLDGTSLGEQPFRAWNDGTLKTISRTCRAAKLSGKTMPVYYDPHELGIRWEVAGSDNQNLRYMLVEFPVPEEPVADEVTEEAKQD